MIAGLPRNESLVVPGILVSGLLQLWLCLGGQLDIGLVVCVFAAEGILLVPLMKHPDGSFETFKTRLAWAGICVAAGVLGGLNAHWTPWTILAAGALWTITVGTWAWEARERRIPIWHAVSRGAALLHLLVVLVGLLGLVWSYSHRTLSEHGWTDGGVGIGDSFSTWLISQLLASDLEPLTVPAVLLVVFRTMNEFFLELYRLLGSNPSCSDAPSSSRTTA